MRPKGMGLAPYPVFADDRIQHVGQFVALVVADTFEAAREGAHLVTISYDMDRRPVPILSLDASLAAAQVYPKHMPIVLGHGSQGSTCSGAAQTLS
eukprot:4290113-Amphidinium_carterae.1